MSEMEKIEMKLTSLAPGNQQPIYRSRFPMIVGAVLGGIVAYAFPQIHVSDLGLLALATIVLCLAASMFFRRRLGAAWRLTHLGVRSALFLAHASFGFALASVCIGLVVFLKG